MLAKKIFFLAQRACTGLDNTQGSARVACIIIIKNEGRIKGDGETQRTSKNASQRGKPQGPGKAEKGYSMEEAKNRSVPHPRRWAWEELQTKEC